MATTRTYRNQSNITFGVPADNPGLISVKDNYRSHSQVGKMMKDTPEVSKEESKQVYRYKNNIVQREFDYSVPLAEDPRFQKNNEEFSRQFARQRNKFTKPYADCTKFVDNLIQNRQLLRRGQFDLPTQNIDLQSKTRTKTNPTVQAITKTQNTQFIRSGFSHRKNYQTMQNIRKKNEGGSDRKKGFDKTLQNHFSSYQNLLKEERWEKKDQVGLQNSMNRILGAEMINYRLMSANNTLRPTKSVKL